MFDVSRIRILANFLFFSNNEIEPVKFICHVRKSLDGYRPKLSYKCLQGSNRRNSLYSCEFQ